MPPRQPRDEQNPDAPAVRRRGDNSVSGERLKSFLERIERLDEERKAISSDIRDVLSEAKGVGYDVKTIRHILKLRAMDAADRSEQEAMIDVYKHAIGLI